MTIAATSRIAPVLLVMALLAGCAQATGSGSPGPTRPAGPTGPSPTPSPTEVAADYVFPVRAGSARFGKAHHDYPATDIFAPCGTAALAVTAGVVDEVARRDTWTASKNDGATRGGLSVSILGADGVRYYGSHLESIGAAIVPGHRVRAGDVLGRVGRTGSARSTPCHLHFGISPPACAVADWWNRRGVLSPYPFLTSWQDGGRRSPVRALAAWRADHGCPSRAPKQAR